ncbi:MAG: hypothetical protein MUF00_06400, partial [Gemmatimonadaceae bacterium]|nr:hypothetical protein [Gemmatimonadaceae bacterium]
MLRDLDVALHWSAEAAQGRYELDAILGYIAGLPTYSLMAELASGRVLSGVLPPVGAMPTALVAAAPLRWRFARDFSLEYARMHAARGNMVGALAQAAKATFEEAHARVCEQGQWVLNEKHLLAAAGIETVDRLFAAPPPGARDAMEWLHALANVLDGARSATV